MILVLVGFILTLANLKLVRLESIWDLWPILLIGWGMGALIRSGGVLRFLLGLLALIAGIAILLNNLYLMELRLTEYWPVLLIILGIDLVWNAQTRFRVDRVHPLDTTKSSKSFLRAFSFLGGSSTCVTTDDFRGGEVTAIMGACEIDLRRARIADTTPTLEVLAVMGGIEIRVPPSWRVTVRGTPFLGAFADKTEPPSAPSGPLQELVVSGSAIMGGVEIKN
jgi:predicted membrane protein